MQILDFVLRLGAALLMGAVVGLERQWRQRTAGLRTNTLVCVGSCLFVTLGLMTPHEGNPTQIAAQVVSGIGFLGAGVIIRNGASVSGLNTAATLWCAAAVGVLCGFGHALFAAIGAAGVLAANVILRPIARKIIRETVTEDEGETHYRIRAVCRGKHEQQIRSLLLHAVHDGPMRLQALQSADTDSVDRMEVRADVTCLGRCDEPLEHLVARLSLEQSISAISWQVIAEEEE